MKSISYSGLLRWTAILLGLLPSAFFLLFLIGEGLAQLFDGKTSVLPILILMVITVSGYILALKRPKPGGLIMMAGGFLMGVYLLILGGADGWMMSVAYALPFMLPGFLFFKIKRQPAS